MMETATCTTITGSMLGAIVSLFSNRSWGFVVPGVGSRQSGLLGLSLRPSWYWAWLVRVIWLDFGFIWLKAHLNEAGADSGTM